jgi:hypothetical protein
MIIKRATYAIYHTSNSDGMDICIKDDLSRFAILSTDDVNDLIEDLVRISMAGNNLADAKTKFEDL